MSTDAARRFIELYQRGDLEARLERVILRMYAEGINPSVLDAALLISYGAYDGLPDAIELYLDKAFTDEVYVMVNDSFRFVVSEANAHADPAFTSFADLVRANVSVGTWFTTGGGFTVDAPVRREPIVIYDGRWLPADREDTHASMIRRAFPGARVRATNLRDLALVDGVDRSRPVIFANALGDAAVVEAWANVDGRDVVTKLTERCTSVYWYDQMENLIVRLL